jgi:hypothetical protein
LRIYWQNIKEKIKCWLVNQHMTLWQGLTNTKRQAREMISSPSLAVRTRLLSFSRMESRVVTDLLTGQNSRRRHLYVSGLFYSLVCRRRGTEKEKSTHVLCECEALETLRRACLGSLSWTLGISEA